MKISDLIKELEKLKDEHGDIETKTQSLSHIWDPEISVREPKGGKKYIILNT